MATDAVRRAAERLRKAQAAGREGKYAKIWPTYADVKDIETLMDFVLPEKAEATFTVTISLPTGDIVKEMGREEYEAFYAAVSLGYDGGEYDGQQPEEAPLVSEAADAFEPGLTNGGNYVTGTGQFLGNVHPESACEGRACVIHNPSDHPMKDWPTNWRHGGAFDIKPPHMERMCEHGVGHPDPDDAAYQAGLGQDITVHGCDGCCRPVVVLAEIQPEPDTLSGRRLLGLEAHSPGADGIQQGDAFHTHPADYQDRP